MPLGLKNFFPVISGAILNIEDVGKSYMNVSYDHCLAPGTCGRLLLGKGKTTSN